MAFASAISQWFWRCFHEYNREATSPAGNTLVGSDCLAMKHLIGTYDVYWSAGEQNSVSQQTYQSTKLPALIIRIHCCYSLMLNCIAWSRSVASSVCDSWLGSLVWLVELEFDSVRADDCSRGRFISRSRWGCWSSWVWPVADCGAALCSSIVVVVVHWFQVYHFTKIANIAGSVCLNGRNRAPEPCWNSIAVASTAAGIAPLWQRIANAAADDNVALISQYTSQFACVRRLHISLLMSHQWLV